MDGQKQSITKIAFASAIGCTIEWYDFFLYGTVTPLVFNKLFFPNFDPVVGTLLAYTTFFVGFISRPIGGILFGHFGDKLGRKTILVLTLLVMGVATFLIGFLPSYAAIGIWSPLILLLLRVFQGIGIGGEWGGAVLMAVEHSPGGKRGFYGSWPQIGVPAGLLLSAGFVSGLSLFGDAAFLAWGWRLCFLISAVLVAVGLYVRLKILETPAFEKLKSEQAEVPVPFVELIGTHGKNVLLGMGARYIEGVCFNTWGVFIIAYVTGALHMSRQAALWGVIITCAAMIVMLPYYSVISDRLGRRRVFGWGAIGIGLLAFPSFWLMDTHSTVLVWLAILIPFGIVYPAVYGPEAALFSELFDTRVRYSGVSFVYQASGIFASGLTPIIATWLLSVGGGRPWIFCGYVVVVAAISALSVYAMRETLHRDMVKDEQPRGDRMRPAVAPQA
jgi:metabolite-proton symporter